MAPKPYTVVRHAGGWAVEKDGERIGRYNLEVEAQAAALEMARNDGDERFDRAIDDGGYAAPHIPG